jgi:SAM-dependent methyltransferase
MESPLTGKRNVKRLGTASTSEIAARWKNRFNVEVGSVFRNIGELQYYRCEDTGLHWYAPAAAAGGSDLYAQMEKFDWYYMPEKWEFSIALEMLEPNNKVLEVGVGSGFFLEKCKAKGVEAIGLELNHSAARRVREKGFQVYEVNLDALAGTVGANGFDAICSFQVLEHVAEPGKFLEGMLKNLRIGGRLILSVPNGAVMRRIDPERKDLLNQPPHHMSHWDAGVFEAIEKFFPVRFRSVRREPLANYHVNSVAIGYFRGLFSGLGGYTTRILFNRVTLFPVATFLNLGFRKWVPGHTLLVELEKVA